MVTVGFSLRNVFVFTETETSSIWLKAHDSTWLQFPRFLARSSGSGGNNLTGSECL